VKRKSLREEYSRPRDHLLIGPVLYCGGLWNLFWAQVGTGCKNRVTFGLMMSMQQPSKGDHSNPKRWIETRDCSE
jgi:hypothetical protein